jgi:hypothetical protein
MKLRAVWGSRWPSRVPGDLRPNLTAGALDCVEDRGASLGGGRRLIWRSEVPSTRRSVACEGTTRRWYDYDHSRPLLSAYIIAWKLCATMKTQDVTDRET